MKVSLDAPYASVHVLDYGKHHKGKIARGSQLHFLPESQKIMHLAPDAKIKSPEI